MLEGIRILDLTRAVAGPYCTMLLGDLGADIVKVEPPDGDNGRRAGLSRMNDQSTYFLAMNRNKRSIAIDLKTGGGRGVLEKLIETSDVLVENYRPGVLGRLGFPSERLSQLNSSLIVCSISGYGATGPYSSRKGLDLMGQAMSGLAWLTGDPDGPPMPMGLPITDVLTGLNACVSILASLCARRSVSSRPGDRIDVSLIGSALSAASVEASAYLNAGTVATRTGGAFFEMHPYGLFATSDGWVAIGADRDWPRLCEILGLGDEFVIGKFATMKARLGDRGPVTAAIEAGTRNRTTAELVATLESADILCGPVYSPAQLAMSDWAKERSAVLDLDHDIYGHCRVVDSSFLIDSGGEPLEKTRMAPPMLGEHSLELMRELAIPEPEIEALCADGSVLVLPY